MKQMQIENCSSINAIKLRQDTKMHNQVLFSRTLKKTFPMISILMSTHQRKKVLMIKKMRIQIASTILNDINIKLSSNNNAPNKRKTNNDNLGINNNKSHNNPLKIKDNEVINKVNNDSSNFSNNNKTNDNNNNSNNNDDNNKTIIIIMIMIIIIVMIIIMITICIVKLRHFCNMFRTFLQL